MEKKIKITKTMRNEDIIAMLKGLPVTYGTTVEQAVAHLTHENELLAKKNSGDSKKATKAQQENEGFKAQILEFLSSQTEGVTATDVMAACGLSSNQKAAALLKAMTTAGDVVKEVVKGKSLFSVAMIATEDEGEGV